MATRLARCSSASRGGATGAHGMRWSRIASVMVALSVCYLAHASEDLQDEAAIAEELAFGATGARLARCGLNACVSVRRVRLHGVL